MSKHTPGPWKYCGCGKCSLVWAGERLVHEGCASGEGYDVATGEEAVANARLIAAAPDLLEALKEVLEHIDSHCLTEGDCNQARAAIAKAESSND